MKLSPLAFVLGLALSINAAEETYSANPDAKSLLAAGQYSKSSTVRVEKQSSSWTINRHGQRVPIVPGQGDGTSVQGGGYHLKYLALRGLSDLPALILEVSGTPYRATYFSKDDFKGKVKAGLEFGRLPVLEVQGTEISQSASIVRFLAEKTGLAGSNLADRVRCDVLFETHKDLFIAHGVWGKSFDIEALRRGPTQGEAVLHFRETANRGEYTAFQKAAVALKTFEDLLQTGSSGWLVGDAITYVDLALWQKLTDLGQPSNLGPGWADKLGFPLLANHVLRINSIPELASFVFSGRRMPKITRIDGDYHYVTEEVALTDPTVPKITNKEL